MLALVDSSSDMLLKGSCAGSLVQQDDEPLNGLHGFFINVSRCSGEDIRVWIS